MKKLPLSSPAFQYVEKAFGEWLDVLGYAKQTADRLPVHAREFMHELEEGRSRTSRPSSRSTSSSTTNACSSA